ncbi:Threonyl/alanyl tRNA synthetase, partial [Pavlovales sp. CCMP2436]
GSWHFEVRDTQVYAGYVVHVGRVSAGKLTVGASAQTQVDIERRRKIAPNHSMTHVLNLALRKALGNGVDQRGSQCDEDKLRFDFSHNAPLSEAQLRAVEKTVSEVIAAQVSTTPPLPPSCRLPAVPPPSAKHFTYRTLI